MTRILIEGYELDIDKGLSNQITYSVSDLKNLDSKTTSFTKTIVLPGTTNNNTLLGNIFEFNNANYTNSLNPNVGYNYNAAKTAQCSIQVNGMVVIKGVFKILEIIIDGKNVEYECNVTGELGGFSMKMGAKKIEELDFSAYNHTYNISNITGSWVNENAGAGYYYPHIDYGTYSTNKHDWQYGTFRPALFVKEYLEKIFAANGYTYECDLFSTDRFKRLIIPHNQKRLASQSPSGAELNVSSSNVTVNPITSSSLQITQTGLLGNFTTTNNILFTYAGTTSTTVAINAYIYVFNYTYSSGGVYTYPITLNLNKNGIAIKSVTISSNGPGGLSITGVALNIGDYLDLSITNMEVGYSITYSSQIRCATGSASILVPIYLNDNLTVNDCIPKNIMQKDFFASILKLFNLYVDENRFEEKHLIIKPYVDYYDGSVEDWSDKIDRGKVMRIKPMSELNSRYYSLKYKDDTDFWNDLYKKRYNEGYGSRIFDTEYEFSKETETVELIFAPTPLLGYAGEDKIYSTIFKQSNAVEETIDSVIRIMIAAKVTVSSYGIYNGATLLTSPTTYGYAGHFNNPNLIENDLNFGATKELFFTVVSGSLSVNQFNVYYSPYMAEITSKDSRLLTCNVKLTDVDIFNLNFASFKYIDGGLYRLIQLVDYVPEANETTKAEFLRVTNKEY